VDDGGSRQSKSTGRIKIYLIVGLALVLAALVYRYLHARAAQNRSISPPPATATVSEMPELPDLYMGRQQETQVARPNIRELRRLFVRDIFAPAKSLPKAGRPTMKGQPAQRQVKSLKLKGVIIGGQHSIAIINDKFVRTGERIDGYRVVRIAEKEVLLKSGNKTIKLRLVSND
jgi:type II secretory pathway component PulC